MFCKCDTAARKRYKRDVQRLMMGYLLALFCSAWLVKHASGQGPVRYVWAVLPTLPIVGVIARMGKYLQEETDEYQRLLQMKAILGGTGALLTALVVSDFLRAFAKAPDFAPFVLFMCFGAGMGVMQFVQWMRNRVPGDE